MGERGYFIAFEGGEGAGKSTQIRLLADRLADEHGQVVVTREPGGTPLAEAIRGLLLDTMPGPSARTEALLFAAARSEHSESLIRPALESGAVVLSDRYVDSSLAYQGVARGLGAEDVMRLSMWGTDSLLPDLTIVLDIDPDLGLARAGTTDRMEHEPMQFHRMVRQAFLELATTEPERYLVLDAQQDAEALASQIWSQVEHRLDAR